MTLPADKRVQHLRLLAGRVARTSPSSQRDELLHRMRVRIVDIEARDELGPPSRIRERPAGERRIS